ncbi:tryptophan synthase subunit alpha [Enterococcus hirae]|nr:tryptophan synthase subunit alpha [Enterococcus hirae]
MDIICYLSNGYPTHEKTLENAANYVRGGCDIIEVDLPTSDPFLDNELIQNRMIKSYAKDPELTSQAQTFFDLRKKFPQQRLFALCYEATIISFGVENFRALVQDAAVEAVILVGPKDNTVKNQLIASGIRVASFIPFDLPEKEIQLAKESNGFVYLQAKSSGETRPGIDTLKKAIAYLRDTAAITQKIYCGMGIATPEDIKMVKEAGGDGAFIGSGLLKKEDDPAQMVEYLQCLKNAARK